MAIVVSSVQSTTEDFLNNCAKEQLLKLVELYNVDVREKTIKGRN